MGKPTDRFIAVDYQLLQQAWRNLEAKKHAPPQVEGSVEAVRAAEDRARTAEAQARTAEAQARNTAALSQEVETLKKQLESIQKQLGNQPTGQSSQNQKTTPPAK
jgi:predicted  nucleic acid-binding Zn-ribbon protein